MALDNNANWIKCGFSLLYYSLNYLLKLQALQSTRLFLSAKQENTGSAGVESQADVVPQWSPSHSGLHFQLSHVLKLWFAEGMCRKTQKANLQEHSCLKKSLSRDLHQTGTSEKKEITDGFVEFGVLEVDFSSTRSTPAVKDSQIWLSQPPALSEHPSFTTASRSLLCSVPWFVLRAFCASQQCQSWIPSWAARAHHWACVPLRGSSTGEQPTLSSLFFKIKWALTHCSACTAARQSILCKHRETWSSGTATGCFPQLTKHSKVCLHQSTCTQPDLPKFFMSGETLCQNWDQMMAHSSRMALEQQKAHGPACTETQAHMMLEGQSAIKRMT